MEEFIKKYCKNCKENCNKGIIETSEFIRCIDRNITMKKYSKKY